MQAFKICRQGDRMMKSFFKIVASCLMPLAFFGCVAADRGRVIFTYDLDKITIVVYPAAESLTNNLDPVHRLVMEMARMKFHGYLENSGGPKPVIHTTEDFSVLLHELAHYFRPEWKHLIPCDDKDLCLEPFVTRRPVR